MITVTVRKVGPPLGARETEHELPEGTSVDNLLDEFARENPDVVLSGKWVRILLNGRDVRFLPPDKQTLSRGDKVLVMPTLGGG